MYIRNLLTYELTNYEKNFIKSYSGSIANGVL